jgi:hypothetical protein
MCLPCRGVAASMGWRGSGRGGKQGWRGSGRGALVVFAQCTTVARGCVGGQGGAQNCGEWVRVSGYMLVSAAHVFPCQDVAASMVGCAGGLYLIVLPSSAVLAQSKMAARGCVGGPGGAQSSWEWIRARASLLASRAHVFASAVTRWFGKSIVGCAGGLRTGRALSIVTGPLARGCVGGPGRVQSC